MITSCCEHVPLKENGKNNTNDETAKRTTVTLKISLFTEMQQEFGKLLAPKRLPTV